MYVDKNLSNEQKLYFQNSKVRDEQGNLLKVYHGSGTQIEAFDPMFTSQGNDQYGSGFYFTTERRIADGYTRFRNVDIKGNEVEKLGGEDNPSIVEAYINLENPIYIDGTKELNLSNISIPKDIVFDIVKTLPTLYHSVDNEDEINPLSDYLEEFWICKPKAKEEFIPLIEDMVERYFQDTNLKELDLLFGKYGTELRKAVNKYMKHDGVIVDFKENRGNYVVAWFPEQIKDVKNLMPEKTPYLMDRSMNVRVENNKNRSIKSNIQLAKEMLSNKKQAKEVKAKEQER